MEDESRRPKTSPNRTPTDLEKRVVEAAKENPLWGARKLRRYLQNQGQANLPSPSTFVEILRRSGIQRHVPAPPGPWQRFEHPEPNDVVQMDFKGHFAIGDKRCHPFTMLDDHSRFSLAVQSCEDEKEQTAKKALEEAFRRYGLPWVILCDNGSPWGTAGGEGPSSLEVWLMKQGIQMWHGRAYHPQTQGKLERFHKTLKLEAIQGRSFRSFEECQETLNEFRHRYNFVRPHQALGMDTPGARYRPSKRDFDPHPAGPEYPDHYFVRRVSGEGRVSFQGHRIHFSKAFIGEAVGLHQLPGGLLDIYFYAQKLKTFDLEERENV